MEEDFRLELAVRCRAWARAERCSGHGHPQRSRHGIGFHTRFRGIDRYGKHHRAAVLWLGRGQGRRGEACEGGEGGRGRPLTLTLTLTLRT